MGVLLAIACDDSSAPDTDGGDVPDTLGDDAWVDGSDPAWDAAVPADVDQGNTDVDAEVALDVSDADASDADASDEDAFVPDAGVQEDSAVPVDVLEPPPDVQEPPPHEDAGGAVEMCHAEMELQPDEGALHVALCSPITYASNPPSSGSHYPTWADYRSYGRPIPWGFLVHSLEHGAIVLSYNCPEGCPDEVANAQRFIDGLPADCPGIKRRLILVPDPGLDVRFAASAWRYTLKADCFDATAFRRFYDERYNKGREDSCNPGTDPTGETAGRPLCGL